MMNRQHPDSVQKRSSPEKIEKNIRQPGSRRNSRESEHDNLLLYESFYELQTKDKSCFKSVLSNLSENLEKTQNQNNYYFNFPRLHRKLTNNGLQDNAKQSTVVSNSSLLTENLSIPKRSRSQSNRNETVGLNGSLLQKSNEVSWQRSIANTPVLPQILPAKTVGVNFDPPKKSHKPQNAQRNGAGEEEIKSQKQRLKSTVNINQQLIEIMKKMQSGGSFGDNSFKVPVLEAYKNYAFHPSPIPKVLAVSNLEHQRHYSPEIPSKRSQRRLLSNEGSETKAKVRLTEEELRQLLDKYSSPVQETANNSSPNKNDIKRSIQPIMNSNIQGPIILQAKKHHPNFDFRLKELSIIPHLNAQMKSEEIVENINKVLRAGRLREINKKVRAESNGYFESKKGRKIPAFSMHKPRQLEGNRSNQSMIEVSPITKNILYLCPKKSNNDLSISMRTKESYKF